MKRLSLLVVLAASLSSCALPSLLSGGAPLPADPRGATFTREAGPSFDTLTFLPGKESVQGAVAHLTGPALRVNDERCQIEAAGLVCSFGTVLQGERRVIYVSGLRSGHLSGQRGDGSPVDVGLK